MREFDKRQVKKIRTWLRRLLQLFFFIWFPSVYTAAFSGVKYLFTRLGAGEPVELTSFVTVLLVICLYTMVFGRFFCGFACAFGSLGDAVYGLGSFIRKKKKKKPLQVLAPWSQWLLWIKYLVLILLAVLCFTGVYASTKGSSPWEVFSMLHTGNLKLSGYAVGGNLLILILIGMVLQERFFCRFLCPLGAVFSLLPVFPFFALKRDRENCAKGCKGCIRICPADVELPDAAGADSIRGECFQCQKCIDVCPKTNIHCGIRWLKGNELWLTLIKAAVLTGIYLWLNL